jgi:hypothetical protein
MVRLGFFGGFTSGPMVDGLNVGGLVGGVGG